MGRRLEPGTLLRLLAWQWTTTLGVTALVAGVGRVSWGAWLPVGAYLVGTALWGWSAAGRGLIGTRASRKQLAWAVGWRGALLCGSIYLVMVAAFPDHLPLAWGGALAVAVLLTGIGSLVLTMLTVIALDAAQSSPGS